MKIGIIGAVLTLSLGLAGCQSVTYPQNADNGGPPVPSLSAPGLPSPAPADVFDQTGTGNYDSPTFPLDPTKSYHTTLKVRLIVGSCDPQITITDGPHEYGEPLTMHGAAGDTITQTWIFHVADAGNYRVHLTNVTGCGWEIRIVALTDPTASPS